MNNLRSIVKAILKENDIPKKNGITFETDFTEQEKEYIYDTVESDLSYFASKGYSEGEIIIEWDGFPNNDSPYRVISGWYWLKVEYDEDLDEDITNQKVSELIKQGNSSGYQPTFNWKVNIWE